MWCGGDGCCGGCGEVVMVVVEGSVWSGGLRGGVSVVGGVVWKGGCADKGCLRMCRGGLYFHESHLTIIIITFILNPPPGTTCIKTLINTIIIILPL